MFETVFHQNPMLMWFAFSVLALLIGSLLNAIIYRLPLMIKNEWYTQCESLLQHPISTRSNINLFVPRSFCPHCEQTIAIWHNIPLLSYCLLRGYCHHCQQKIPLRYLIVEILTLLLFVFALWFFGPSLKLLFSMIFIAFLITIFFIDLEHQMIPDSLSLGLLWIGLLCNIAETFGPLSEAVLSAAGAYLFLWLMIKGYAGLSGKVGMGHGDFKLFAAFGAWFGWTQLPLILLLSSFLGAIIGLCYLKITQQSKDTPIPFGPFLCISGLVALFFGQAFMGWYLS